MPSDRTKGVQPSHVTVEAASDDPIVALIRAHGCVPPYDAVDWRSVAARVLQKADGELERLRTVAQKGHVDRRAGAPARDLAVARISRAPAPGWRSRSWWEVTAGWVRPAVMAAAASVIVAGTLVVVGPSVASNSQSSEAVALRGPTGSTAADGTEAALLDSPTGAVDAEVGTVTRDSLFTALVDGP